MLYKNYESYLLRVFTPITSQRSALMGLAMLAVFLTHAPSVELGFIPIGVIGFICQYGSWGVDVFLFLSAVGLCYSLQKNNLKTFYKNRIVRILPVWLIVLLAVHLAGVMVSYKMPDINFNYPQDLIDCISWYSGLGFFFDTCHYEWYIPSLLLFYFISPFLFRLSIRNNYLLIACCLIFVIISKYYALFPHLDLMVMRLPVFCLGFVFYKEYQEGSMMRFLLAECFYLMLACILCVKELCSATIVFGFLIPIILMVISHLFNILSIIPAFLTVLGSISLEFYLIHLYRRPQFLISFWVDNSNWQVVLSFILCFCLAYILHKSINYILKRCLY